ncbi:MAG: hypothetical protein J5758_06395, partial [Abditibacteriota bacterium]|nr:hypothetical protein [Abditibacteriota bacterium]
MFFSETFEPWVNDYDSAGRLTFEAILEMLESISAHHCISVSDNLASQGISWVLLDWRIRILRQPAQFRSLQVRTWVNGSAPGGSTVRNYTVTDREGSELIRAAARFALVDMQAQRSVRITEEILRPYEPEELSVFGPEPARLREPDSFDGERDIVLRRSDFDFNGHVHNTRYIEFALEALPEKDYAGTVYTQLRIAYRRAVTSADRVTVKRKAIEDGMTFCLYAGGRLCAIA